MKSKLRTGLWVLVMVAAAAVLGGIVWVLAGVERVNAREQLAAINAQYAVPDSENAALIYEELWEKWEESEPWPVDVSEEVGNYTLRSAWSSDEYPRLVEWMGERQYLIDGLLRATKKEGCFFPIALDGNPLLTKYPQMVDWGRFLIRSANRDLGEGRVEEAVEKYCCAIQMAIHLCRQPEQMLCLRGIAVRLWVFRSLSGHIMKGRIGRGGLERLSVFLPVEDGWQQNLEVLQRVEKLQKQYWQEGMNFFERIRFRLVEDDFFQFQFDKTYVDEVAYRRGLRILIGLRKYRDIYGRWPETLEQIESIVVDEALVDPHTQERFVYRTVGDSFKLYSQGQNCVDEGGMRAADFRDSAGADDVAIWPLQTHKSVEEEGEQESQ